MSYAVDGFESLTEFLTRALVPADGPTPYAGLWTNPHTGHTTAPRSAAHLFIDCPTGGGKTTAVLAPAMICHPGPVLGVSSKDDILKLVSERRHGPLYVIDLRQIDTPDYRALLAHDNLVLCRIDPTTMIKKHDDALNMATWLVRVSNMAMGGRVTQHGEPYWTNQIVPSLAAILYAASPVAGNKGIDWALRCVLNPRPHEPDPEPVAVPSTEAAQLAVALAESNLRRARLLAAAPSPAVAAARLRLAQAHAAQRNAPDPYDPEQAALVQVQEAALAQAEADDEEHSGAVLAAEHELLIAQDAATAAAAAEAAAHATNAALEDRQGQDPVTDRTEPRPSWWDISAYLPAGSLLIDWLEFVAQTHERQRDSVAMGMSGALFPWVYESVRRGISADDKELPIFRVDWLDRPDATVIILAEPEGGGVGAALPLVQAISTEWRRQTSLEIRRHNLLIGIDETTNTLPMHNYDVLASEARGLGINLMVCVQSTKQLANRYDTLYADAVMSVFPAMLVMYGSTSDEPLEMGSQWSGLSTRHTETFDQSTGARGLLPDEGPLLLPIELLPTIKYTGRLIWRGSEGIIVNFPSFEQFLEIYDNNLVEGLNRLAVPR